MPGKDLTRWEQNDDGSWTRTTPNPAEYPEPDYDNEDEPQIDATAGAIEAADELGVDLTTVVGTGSLGRITKADVEAAAGG